MKTTKQKLEDLQTQFKELQNSYNKKINDLNTEKRALQDTLENERAFNVGVTDKTLFNKSDFPLFNFNINDQFLQNGNYNVNLDIMIKQSWLRGGSSSSNFFEYQLVLQRAQYFKSRVDIQSDNFLLQQRVKDCLYWASLCGWVALTKNLEIIDIEDITNEKLHGFNVENGNEVYSNDYVILEFNENHFSIWVLAWAYLKLINKYFGILDRQTNFLISQLAGKVDLENLNNNNPIIQEKLFNLDNFIIWFSKNVEIAPLPTDNGNLAKTFDFIENFKNWMDFHLLKITTKDVTSNKERDVASQQSNYGQLAIINNKYLDNFLDMFLYQIKQQWGEIVTYDDFLIKNQEAQATQSLTLNKLNDKEEKEKIENGDNH